MDDSELTKKAIEELVMEMNVFNENERLPGERKKNPLGKPNKRFLGRTLNSVMTHNKRQIERNHQRCQRKLKELDAKQRKRKYKRANRKKECSSSKSDSSQEVVSSDINTSVDGEHQKLKNSKALRKKMKKKRAKQRKSFSSSSNETNSSSEENSSKKSKDKIRKKKRHKIQDEYQCQQENYSDASNECNFHYYVDPNMAYAAMAYSQMHHVLHHQQIIQQQLVKEELVENVEIPSDLCVSCTSDSSLNISLNSSSAEEDENGILTFKILSSEDEKISCNSIKTGENYEKNIYSITSHKDNKSNSVESLISLESVVSQKNVLKEYIEVDLLSSSSSDSVYLVPEDTIANNITNVIETNNDRELIKINEENGAYKTDQLYEEIKNVDEEKPKSPAVNEEESEKHFTKISMVDLTND